ncbi:HD domain-containing protein [Paenibacillus filicis]|uniref:HD domain-containing protein n=1 Tax=Paenibacillus gyeongsangnamensis TaxID=3388067 RepID=A0ABT4Q719_9BACL|nr:HD domain-containing phosphohydrolase [Paenibacillus filicis]MCZ8512626.1 HD domain-containing protein [Paenibacillus filicis]
MVEKVNDWLLGLYQLYTSYSDWTVLAVTGMLILSLAGLLILNGMKRRADRRLSHALTLLERLQPSAGLENNLTSILELIGSVVSAPEFAFYIYHSKNKQYVLKAVRSEVNEKRKGAGGKERYLPPLSIPAQPAPTPNLAFIKEGEVPVLSLPVGDHGLIRIAPMRRLQGLKKRQLRFIAGLLPRILDVLIETDAMKLDHDVVVTSGTALHDVCSMALDSDTLIQKMIHMLSVALDVTATAVFVQKGGRYDTLAQKGFGPECQRSLASAGEWIEPFLSGKDGDVVVHEGEPLFDQVPRLMISGKGDHFIFCRLKLSWRDAVLVCRVQPVTSSGLSESERLASIRAAAKDMTRLTNIQEQMKPYAASYTELLKMISRSIDNLNPYTVGYSELMARYSVAIAQELKLPKEEIASISLAAYLSNIGVLGLSEELYLKEGKYSEAEFEKMKLHAEVGASIVEMTIGDKLVADCIRYHHERMDGNGYPAGIRGDEIPVGARIIAVVQTFLAKIGGRKYREPLPFDKAMGLVRSIAGAQLDPNVVDALIRWFEGKRQSRAKPGFPLGPCWEMCCTPSDICKTCPAYDQMVKPCWEFEKNNCQSHGKICQSCVVYTETQAKGEVFSLIKKA